MPQYRTIGFALSELEDRIVARLRHDGTEAVPGYTVVMITNLYDAGSHDRVWSIQSTCFDRATMAEVLLDEAVAIIRQLHTDELI